jgi:hypothetical protein
LPRRPVSEARRRSCSELTGNGQGGSATRSTGPHLRALRIAHDPLARPVSKGKLCGQHRGFNLHAATRVAANDKTGRETLCQYILRPPLANDRLHVLPDGSVQLSFERPWSDGTNSIALAPLALIAQLAAIVPASQAPRHPLFRGAFVAQQS